MISFHQMMGRGTRTCPDLFGPGKDKENFLVFDYCGNFEFFDVHPKGLSPGNIEPLSQKIFKKRIFLSHTLKIPLHRSDPDAQRLLDHLLDTLHQDVKNLDTNLFFIRPHRQNIETFSERTRWDRLNITDISNLNEELSPLMAPADDDEIARRFDLLILNLQLTRAENNRNWPSFMKRLREITGELQYLGNIPAVNKHMERIRRTLTETFAQRPSLWELELVRRDLRNLVKFIDREKQKNVYTNFRDTIGDAVEVEGIIKRDEDYNDYREKAAAFIRENSDHLTVYRLRHNLPITRAELAELERLLFENSGLENREEMEKVYGADGPLGRFIRRIVGLDADSVRQAFSAFVAGSNLTADQMEFIGEILNYLGRKGYLEKGSLFEQPFTHYHHAGLRGLFTAGEVDNIIAVIDTINRNALAS